MPSTTLYSMTAPFPIVEQLPGSVSKRPGTLQHRAVLIKFIDIHVYNR